MEKRKISVLTPNSNDIFVIEDEVKTWGDILSKLKSEDLISGQNEMVGLEKTDMKSYLEPKTPLPNKDLFFYLKNNKMKAGADSADDSLRPLENIKKFANTANDNERPSENPKNKEK